MIHPSERWRFVEAAGDKGFFEDDVVQHTVTEHRAMRRSFTEKITADPVALEEIRQQAQLAAGCNPPALPRIYMVEEVKGRFTILMELIEGVPLEDEINHQKYVRPRDWALLASQLLDELMELRQAGARFHKLSSEHLVLLDSGDIKITQRWPVGTMLPATLDASQSLQRMAMQPRVGVYTSTAPVNEQGEMEAVKQILVRMAAGSARHSFEQLREEVKKAPSMHPSPLAGVDFAISQVLMGMHPRPDGAGEYSNLFNVQAAIRTLLDDENRRISQHTNQSGLVGQGSYNQPSPVSDLYATPPKGSLGGGQRSTPNSLSDAYRDPVTGAPREVGSISSRDPISTSGARDPRSGGPPRDLGTGGRTPMPGSTPQRDPASGARRSPHPDPITGSSGRRDPVSGVAPKRDSKSGSGLRQAASIEDVNPYANDPVVEEIAAGPISPPSASVIPAYTPRKSAAGAAIKWVVIAVVVLAALGGGAVYVLPMLKAKPPNNKPVASIAPLAQSTVRMNDIITLDASGSTDEEPSKLTYYWERIAPADGRVILTEAGTSKGGERTEFATSVSKIDAQFITTGDYVFELKINDGSMFSEPVRVQLKVTPLTR
jgi:hypothetical protein